MRDLPAASGGSEIVSVIGGSIGQGVPRDPNAAMLPTGGAFRR